MSALLALFIVLLAIAGAAMCMSLSPPPPTTNISPISVSAVSMLSPEQMQQKLVELEKKPAPKQTFGAMCYDMAYSPQRIEYLCPVCGERSLFTDDRTVMTHELDAMRKSLGQLAAIAPVKLALDESELCVKCSPTRIVRRVVLVVTYPDGTSQRTPDVRLEDFTLLDAFFSGKNQIKEFNDGITPLKNYLPRLRQLLGVVPVPEAKK